MTAAINVMQTAAVSLAALYLLWALFLAVMNLARAKAAGTLRDGVFYLAWPLIVAAYILDIAINVTLGTLLWLQLPHINRLTLSARLDHLIKNGTGWRMRFAFWFVDTLLEPFDTTGGHQAD